MTKKIEGLTQKVKEAIEMQPDKQSRLLTELSLMLTAEFIAPKSFQPSKINRELIGATAVYTVVIPDCFLL